MAPDQGSKGEVCQLNKSSVSEDIYSKLDPSTWICFFVAVLRPMMLGCFNLFHITLLNELFNSISYIVNSLTGDTCCLKRGSHSLSHTHTRPLKLRPQCTCMHCQLPSVQTFTTASTKQVIWVLYWLGSAMKGSSQVLKNMLRVMICWTVFYQWSFDRPFNYKTWFRRWPRHLASSTNLTSGK